MRWQTQYGSVKTIKSVIADKEEELRNKVKTERIVERELKVDKMSEDVVSIITGLRRCGKSTFVFRLT